MLRKLTICTSQLTAALLLLYCLLASNQIWASCVQSDLADGAYYVAEARGVNPPPFNPADYTIGEIIYSVTSDVYVTNNVVNPAIKCTEDWVYYRVGMGIPINDNIYPTNIAGLGLRIGQYGSPAFPIQNGPVSANQWLFWNFPYRFSIELIKTGEITAAGILTGPLAQFRYGSATGPVLFQIGFGGSVPIQPKIPTCAVSTPSLTVPLGNIAANAFNGIGSVSPAQQFSIVLSCSGGDTGTNTNAYVTLTDANNPGNTSTTLSLNSSGQAASGVGLQIMDIRNNQVLGYGPDSNAPANTNQWKAGTIRQGQNTYIIALGARYVQTMANISPGTANGLATFTMSYQ